MLLTVFVLFRFWWHNQTREMMDLFLMATAAPGRKRGERGDDAATRSGGSWNLHIDCVFWCCGG